MGLSHSSRELQQCCCLKPLEPGWHSSTFSRSTDCHSSCQSSAIYLEAWGLLRRGKSREWREWREMKGWDRVGGGGEESGRKERRQKVGWGLAVSAAKVKAGFGIQHFHICNGGSSETGHRKTESQGCLSCRPPLISSQLFAAKPEKMRKEAEEGKRGCFDNRSPFLFSCLQPPLPHRIHCSTFRTSDLTESLGIRIGTRTKAFTKHPASDTS